ncbi:MAG TPA: nitroreductase family deazaflavin-dependent oxidoreductase [Gaiellaceae bacterium]|nr:nitroreductase family deazaflavin-dependent oxidoreductase [Gaiellaceae bacterium]
MRPLYVRLVTRYLGGLHRLLYRASGGRVGARLWDLDVVLLTTTGRKSGRLRTVPLCALRDGESFAVIGSYGGLDQPPAWWLNLQQQPRATVRIGGSTREVIAREAQFAERDRLWAGVTERAPGYLEYQRRTARRIPVVVLEPSRGD